MIELEGATKLYGTVMGVNDIHLRLDRGAWGLLGPNGSGKTTLINLVLGQLRPTLGRVRLFGVNPWNNSRLLSRVGLCPAAEPSLPRVTALQWVTCLTQMHGFRRRDARDRAVRALALVRMDGDMHRPMRDYSLGMRQRVKLAQAIAHDPELLILDEPFNGLDPVGRYEMTRFLLDWVQQGRSLILASHVLHEVEAVRPSFLLISGGRLLASGSPAEVRKLLADSPAQMVIRTDRPAEVASRLLRACPVSQIRLLEDGESLEVMTGSAAALREALPALLSESGVTIRELQSADESLRNLFSTLMRRHRGEH